MTGFSKYFLPSYHNFHSPATTSAMESYSPSLTVRRKNGMQPSCENCRIAKARCDHNNPCERCTRQRKKCYFHPAPMSGMRKASTPTNHLKRPSDSVPASEATRPPPAKRNTAPPAVDRGAEATAIAQPLTPLGYSYSRAPAKMTLGYMGSTGFGAILQENKFASLWDNSDSQPLEAVQSNASDNGYSSAFGASILAWLPRRNLFERAIDFFGSHDSTVFCDQLVMHHFAKFWTTYDHLLREPQSTESLRALSDILTQNTSKPVCVPSSNSEWLDSFSGENSRWEFIGIVFISMGFSAFSVPSSDPLFSTFLPKNMSRKNYACTMLECADAILAMVEKLSNSGSLFQVWLLIYCIQLQSMVAGDTSHELWKRTGTLVAAVTGLGLHLPANEAESRSALYRELRSQALSGTFSLDKTIATFVGRPPLLSRRYISANEILDVPAEKLVSESSIEELEKEVDRNGWNVGGKLLPSTQRRAIYRLNHFRDEILELSLSTIVTINFSAQIADLRARMDEMINELPAIYHSKFDKKLISEKNNYEILGIAQVQAMHLHNCFLCERIEHPEKDEQRLLQAARDLLAITVLFWSERDRYSYHRDFIQ